MSRCSACGRPLRRPSPSGLGPVCAKRLGLQPDSPPRQRRPPRPATRTADAPPEVHPDQTALPLVEHQPTLWSL